MSTYPDHSAGGYSSLSYSPYLPAVCLICLALAEKAFSFCSLLVSSLHIPNVAIISTSKFVDVHHIGKYTDRELKKFQDLPVDAFGVKVLNIMYNREVGISFYFLEAPNRQAVEKHHEKYGVKCNWITKVQTTA